MFQSCSSFFLCLLGQPELCGSYHLLQSCFSFHVVSMAKLSRSVATIFSSLAFPSSSVSMANLSRLVAVSGLSFLSNSFSSPRFNLLRVAWCCFSWSSVFFLLYLFHVLSSACLSPLLQSLKLCLLEVSHF